MVADVGKDAKKAARQTVRVASAQTVEFCEDTVAALNCAAPMQVTHGAISPPKNVTSDLTGARVCML